MHVIASDEYLDCADLVPAACESINVDISVTELFAAGGYGYVALLAYDIEEITSVEFAVEGWPTGRGAPTLNGPNWCPDDPHTYGDHRDGGGATAFESCVQPDSNGIALLGYFHFGPLDSSDVPIDFSFLSSTYTEPEDSLLAVTDCSADYDVDEVVAQSGCAIGGGYSGSEPECSRGGDSGGEGGASFSARFIGPRLQEAGDSFNVALVGAGLTAKTSVYLQQGLQKRIAEYDIRFGDVFDFRVQTSGSDRGYWDIVAEHGEERVMLPNAVRVVENRARTIFEEARDAGAEYLPGTVGVKIMPWAFEFPAGRDIAAPGEIERCTSDLRSVFDELRVSRIEKVFPTADRDDARDKVLAKFFRLRFPPSTDMADVLAALDDVPGVMSAWCYAKGTPCAGALHPNDPLYQVEGDTAQWSLHQRSEEYTELADIDMPEAWDLLGLATENMLVGILDSGLRYTHEDMGDTNTFPNWLSPCGYDVVLDVEDPMEETYLREGVFCRFGHGTMVASVVAAATNNSKGIASVGWGTTKLAPFKICDSDSQNSLGYHVKMPTAIDTAVSWCEVDAINISYVFDYETGRTEAKDFGAAVEKAHREGGVFLTASTGNYSSPSEAPYYPAAFPYVTGVTQTTRASCWGDAYWQYRLGYPSTYCPLDSSHCDSSGAMPIWLTDLAAPGGHLLEGLVYKDELIVASSPHDSSYMATSGTSLAAPLVAGIGVYLKDRAQARGITLYPEDIEGLLCATADSVTIMNSNGTCSDEYYATYPNTYCGWGKINAYKAAERIYYGQPPETRQLPDYTLVRYAATGYDICWQDAEFECLDWPTEGDTSFVYRYRVRKSITYNNTYAGPAHAWGYCASYANEGCYADPRRNDDNYIVDPDEMEWLWSGVIPSSMTTSGCTLESFLWAYRARGSTDTLWVTVAPDTMQWGCGVSGLRYLFLDVEADGFQEDRPVAKLDATYPNPFNPATRIELTVPVRQHVTVCIYDVRGRLVSTLMDGVLGQGRHQLEWEGLDAAGRTAASGVYFLRLNGQGFCETRKLVLAR